MRLFIQYSWYQASFSQTSTQPTEMLGERFIFYLFYVLTVSDVIQLFFFVLYQI